MSKKKATMTLKDFHGGSIPSDLPLPSAPGVVVKPLDRPGFDRAAPWGSSRGRSSPSSSQSGRHFDDKSPFLAHSQHIGRNFDEDERKPLDGSCAPRRMVSDESVHQDHACRVVEVKLEPAAAAGRVLGWQGLAPVALSLPSGRGADVANLPNSGNAVSRPYPNAWAVRKDVVVGVVEPVQPAWSQESAVSKLAHASALEKVSSGRWQMKQSVHYQTDVEVVRHSQLEIDNGLYSKVDVDRGFNRIDAAAASWREHPDAMMASHAERSLNTQNGIQGGRKELPDNERARTPTINTDRLQPVLHSDGKVGGSELEPSERPKLNLLPRKKPLESPELPTVDHHQGNLRPYSGHAETENESNKNTSLGKPGSAGHYSGSQAFVRPKLNLKPRSQLVETHQEKIERGRNALFGGARPREMVLKERGVDDVVISNNDAGQDSDRAKHNTTNVEKITAHTVRIRQNEKTENPRDQRMEKKPEKKDPPRRVENWRSSGREPERQPQAQERQPSPETWRKPVEPKPASPDGGGVRHGKAASALELAQAFSRSVSDSKIDDPAAPGQGQRSSLPGRAQVTFSRLMGPQPQINGY